jgi:putative membrane protein
MSPTATAALAATLHLLALGIGLGAIWGRYKALKGPLDEAGIRRVLANDNWWGVAALLWIGTGLWRALGPVAKTWAYYKINYLFHAKMGIFLLLFVLEIGVMITLIRWRTARKRGQAPDLSKARRHAAFSLVQAHLIVVMVVLATLMARGVGMISPGQ